MPGFCNTLSNSSCAAGEVWGAGGGAGDGAGSAATTDSVREQGDELALFFVVELF